MSYTIILVGCICFSLIVINILAEMWRLKIRAKELIIAEQIRHLHRQYFLYKFGDRLQRDEALSEAAKLSLEEKEIPNDMLKGFFKQAKYLKGGDIDKRNWSFVETF